MGGEILSEGGMKEKKQGSMFQHAKQIQSPLYGISQSAHKILPYNSENRSGRWDFISIYHFIILTPSN